MWRSTDWCATSSWIKINDFAQGFGAPDTEVLIAANWNTVHLGGALGANNNNLILAGLMDGECSTVMSVGPRPVPASWRRSQNVTRID